MPGIKRQLNNLFVRANWLRSFLPHDVVIPLRCGVTVRGDLRHPNWFKMRVRGYHELDTERFLAGYLRPGDVVFDVGAQIGMITAVAAKLVGTEGSIYAFEVDDTNYAQLERTIARNHLENVTAENVALSNQAGVVEFVKPQYSWGSFLIADSAPSQEGQHYTRQATTLDTYTNELPIARIDVIKIDVDGPELAILQGTINTVARWQPALIVECSGAHRSASSALLNFLKQHGYRVFAAARGKDRVLSLESLGELPDVTLNLFCYLPGVHDERWSKLWFMREASTHLA